MKILIVGAFTYYWYEEVCARALEQIGHEVIRFSWSPYFISLTGRAELKWTLPGPGAWLMNHILVRRALQVYPDVIFVWRGTHIWRQTLRRLRQKTGAVLVSYNNDDPFGSTRYRRLWHYFHETIPEYDAHFVYRSVNVGEFLQAGGRHVHVLMPYYISEIQRPVILTPEETEEYGCDIMFAGHYEPDERVSYLRILVEAGLHVRLYGTNWRPETLGNLYDYFAPIRPVYLHTYTKALRGAKICLAFLSKLNRDTYTRRSFEIPACGCVMVSEYSTDLCSLFEPDREAVFFSSPGELLNKSKQLIADPQWRQTIAESARQRCIRHGYDVVSRMKEFSRIVSDLVCQS